MVYVSVNEEADLEKNGIAQGYLAERGERCDSRFYQLAIANLLYTDPTGKTNLVQTAGTDGGTYAPVASVETYKTWETDDVFLLWQRLPRSQLFNNIRQQRNIKAALFHALQILLKFCGWSYVIHRQAAPPSSDRHWNRS